MIHWRAGRVVEAGPAWSVGTATTAEYVVQLADDSPSPEAGERVRALAYHEVVGRPIVGDRVLLNVSALRRGLGTGGLALVVAVPDRLPADPEPRPGHLVKGRYGPLQAMVLGADEQESPHHDVLRDADDLAGLPVVVADLHSALPAVLAGLRESAPAARAVYVMTDGGALPAGFSRTVAALRETGWLEACVTTGQAYGGDLEAVTVHTGLLAARLVAGADVAVVAQGPGNLGTGTRWGFSGVAAGEAVNAAATLGGRAVASLRVSQADPRPRHRGVSHHSRTAYGRVARGPADVPVPLLAGELGRRVRDQAAELCDASGNRRDGGGSRLRRCDVEVDGLLEALRGCPVPLRTMGRGLDADPAAFLAAAAAGRHAAALLTAPGNAPTPPPR